VLWPTAAEAGEAGADALVADNFFPGPEAGFDDLIAVHLNGRDDPTTAIPALFTGKLDEDRHDDAGEADDAGGEGTTKWTEAVRGNPLEGPGGAWDRGRGLGGHAGVIRWSVKERQWHYLSTIRLIVLR
jgi:hypothetical protein